MNVRCRYVLDVLGRAFALARRKGCTQFIATGDFLHYRKPEAQLLRAVMDLIAEQPFEVYLLKGNHETVSDRDGDHALGPLAHVARVVDAPLAVETGSAEVVFIPYQKGAAKTWFATAVQNALSKSAGTSPRCLAVHLGVSDNKTEKWLRQADDSIDVQMLVEVCRRHKISHVFAGNWHNRRTWDCDDVQVAQIGALVPTGFNNPGLSDLYGGVACYDHSQYEIDELPGVRFVSLKASQAKKLKQAMAYKEAHGYPVYVKVTAPVDRLTEYATDARELVKEGKLTDVQVYPDAAQASESVRQAATSAKTTDSFHAALDAFLEALTVDEEVDKAAVTSVVKDYVKRASDV